MLADSVPVHLADGKSVPAVVDPGILVVRKDNLKEFWDNLRELKK